MRERAEDLRNRRHLDVLWSRASGIVARERNWEQAKAREWIRQEALRLGYPLLRFSERLILAQTLSRRMAPRPSGHAPAENRVTTPALRERAGRRGSRRSLLLMMPLAGVAASAVASGVAGAAWAEPGLVSGRAP